MQSQDVRITNLETNPGILPLKLGQARIQTSLHDFVHYYDLKPIAQEIETISLQYDSITKALNSCYPYFSNLQNFDISLQYQLKSAKRKLDTIYPIHRTKRGLINGLGSIIKAISGNLDQEDAERYNRAIDSLQNNQENIVQDLNSHISITRDLIENFNSTVSLLSHNQDEITEEINKVSSDLKKFQIDFNHYLRARNVLDQLNLALQTTLQLLTDIENSITFAKIGILHNSIISFENLYSIVNIMSKHHPPEQLLYVQKEELIKYYKVITVDAYYSEHRIVFILHFPLIHPETFTHYHLYSIPTKNLTTIIPPSPFLTMNAELYQYDSTRCMQLETMYLCRNTLIIQDKETKDCIFEILQLNNKAANCHHTRITMTTPLIEQLTEAHYIAIFPNQTKVLTKCTSTEIQTLQGVYLLQLPRGCQFETLNFAYLNTKPEIQEQPLTLPKIETATIQDPEEYHLNIDKIPLDGLQKIHQDQKKLLPLSITRDRESSTHFWTTPLFIIGTLLIIFAIYKCRKGSTQEKKTSTDQHEEKKTSTDRREVFCRPHKTSSKEGGVMDATIP